eukprot:441103_1
MTDNLLVMADVLGETNYGWLGTTASQIFIMQLGFVCYEAGFVHPVWTSTIIHKNIQDTFVGTLTYLLFTHSFVASPRSLGGIISIPNDLYLVNTTPTQHATIFIACMFATTCATIISGGVLERMKNKVYLLWCFFTILINYSFIAHWIWSPNGWLNKLGFMDCGGSLVVHCTGGMAATIAIWNVGPRHDSIGVNGQLKKVPDTYSPIITTIGAFILWYGWFGFNIASAIQFEKVTPEILDTVGLVTMMGATSATFSTMIMMMRGWIDLKIENSMSAMIGGLVSITASCFTIDVWAASIIGFFSPCVCFGVAYVARWKIGLDDPLNVIGIHLGCGVYACIMQGIFANDSADLPGFIYGGFAHFGIQLLGTVVCLIFLTVCSTLIWTFIKRVFFRATSIRVTLLDSYLGQNVAATNMHRSFREIMNCNSNLAKQLVWDFHMFTERCFNSEGLDFLMAVNEFRELLNFEQDQTKCKQHVIAIFKTYIDEKSETCINISGSLRNHVAALCEQLKSELIKKAESVNSSMNGAGEEKMEWEALTVTYDTIFESSYAEVFKMMLPYFQDFITQFHAKRKRRKFAILVPYYFETDWRIIWDQELQKETKKNKNTRTPELTNSLLSNSFYNILLSNTKINNKTIDSKSAISGKSEQSNKSGKSDKSNQSNISNRSGVISKPDPWVEAIALEQRKMKSLAFAPSHHSIPKKVNENHDLTQTQNQKAYDEYNTSFATKRLSLHRYSYSDNPYKPTDNYTLELENVATKSNNLYRARDDVTQTTV